MTNCLDVPGDWLTIPFWGHTIDFYIDREKFILDQYRRYGSPFQFKLLGREVIVLVGPEANEMVLKSQSDSFSIKQGWFFLEPLLSGGLLLQEGNEHRRSRRLLFPAFNRAVIESHSSIIIDTIHQYLKKWSGQKTIELSAELHRLTLTIACRLFLGVNADAEIERLSCWFNQLFSGLESFIPLEIPFTSFGIAMGARREIESFIHSTIRKRRIDGFEGNDVLTLMMGAIDEDGSHLTDSEIVNHTIQLLYAGHETTSKFILWTLFNLQLYPEWMEKIKAEINDSKHDSPLEQVKKMPNLNYFLLEIERLCSSTFIIPRGVIKDVEYQNYAIPKGAILMLSPMLSHRLPTIFAEPLTFDPLRFAPPREEHKAHAFALIGFGAGSHTCLGKELAKLEISLFILLLSNYRWVIHPSPTFFGDISRPHIVEPQLNFTLHTW